MSQTEEAWLEAGQWWKEGLFQTNGGVLEVFSSS